MMNAPLLSVIVPIYNVERYLPECIKSIMAQTYSNLDIILIDDGSVGREREICDEFAAVDNRITVIHKENEGLVAARKTGVSASRGEYIAFVDGDDYIDSNYYEAMMKYIIRHSPDMVAVGISKKYVIGETETLRQSVKSGMYEGDNLEWLCRNMNSIDDKFYDPGIFPSTCTKIYRKPLLEEMIKDIPVAIKMGEDAAVTYPYILRCRKVVVDNGIHGYVYRMSDNTMTKSFDISYFDEISILYSYLSKYYEAASPQLNIYRAYLIYLGINNIMSNAKMIDKFRIAKQITSKADMVSIFENTSEVSCLVIPRSLRLYLHLLKLGLWPLFGLIWALRG